MGSQFKPNDASLDPTMRENVWVILGWASSVKRENEDLAEKAHAKGRGRWADRCALIVPQFIYSFFPSVRGLVKCQDLNP